MSEEEITRDDYVLTNINLWDGCYTIRLKDDKEYTLFRRRKGKKSYHFIRKDDKEIRLSKEVEKWVRSEIRTYERDGI